MIFKQKIVLMNVRLIAIAILALFSCKALAQLSNAGKTIMARGSVKATAEQQSRTLSRRAPIYSQDSIVTGENSAAQIRMIDGGLLSLQESSELAILNYDFDPESKDGSVSMSLIKGGLRTVTGALKTSDDKYRLVTPVATIGVRGTHYEVELIEGDLYLAGWNGIIDVNVLSDNAGQQFSVGPDQNYRFAIVRSHGQVEYHLSLPENFASGHSRTPQTVEVEEENDTQSATNNEPSVPDLSSTSNNETNNNDTSITELSTVANTIIDNERLVAQLIPNELSTTARSGQVTFNQIQQSKFVSTAGQVSNIEISMGVDFNTAIVPEGQLSFTDSGGEWFAVFNGAFSKQVLDLNINFASHGNMPADGSIDAIFVDQANAVLGDINLFEVSNPDIQITGSFVLTDGQP